MLIDYGINNDGYSSHTKNMDFMRSRNHAAKPPLARSSAILTLHTIQEMDKKYKNVSVIIGRVIWESRGDWLN